MIDNPVLDALSATDIAIVQKTTPRVDPLESQVHLLNSKRGR